MENHWIIAVGHQFCSGGAETAKRVAELLGIPFYNRELIDEAAGILNMDAEHVAKHDEKPIGFWEYSALGHAGYGHISSLQPMLPHSMRIAHAQFDAIRKIAKEGPCVIIGHCADQVLKDEPYVLPVFVRARVEHRIERAMQLYDLDEAKAKKMIRRNDKIRAGYYNSHTQSEWGHPRQYAMMLDTGILGIESTAQLIAFAVEQREKNEVAEG